MAYLTLVALILGFLMYILASYGVLKDSKGVVKDIGRILFAAACLGICIAAAPATVHLLQR